MIRLVQQLMSLMVCVLVSVQVSGQNTKDSIPPWDNRYLEDQFYIGVGYNILFSTPDGVGQRNFSYNLQAGFIKDIPLNQRRNFGLGLGLGYAANSYYTNMGAAQGVDGTQYQILADTDFNRSKFETHSIEVPFEIRWRTSTADDYSFWRIYAGVKLGYVFSGRSKSVTDDGNDSFSNDDIQAFQYGLMLNFGFNTWNIHAYYNLNPLLEDNAMLNGAPLDFRVLRIGLTFYIL